MTNKEYVCKYAAITIGNIYGAMGLCGNIQSESGFRTDNMENSYEAKTGWNDKTYHDAINDGTYRNYRINNGVRQLAVNHNSSVREAYGYDSIGDNLPQWTYYSLKLAFYDYMVKRCQEKGIAFDITNLELSTEYLLVAISNMPTLWNELVNSTSIETSAKNVLLEFERPADQSQAVIDYRGRLARQCFNEVFGGQTTLWVELNGNLYHFTYGKLDKNKWFAVNGKWYYVGSAGIMLTNAWVNYQDKWYWCNSNGEMASKQWTQDGEDWYYINEDGTMATNQWVHFEDDDYYLGEDGKMVTNQTITIDGKQYTFDKEGKANV